MQICPSCKRPMFSKSGVIVDPSTRSINYDGETAVLTKREFDIITVYHRHFGEFVSAERVMDQVYQLMPDCDRPYKNVLDVFTGKLRTKIEPMGLRLETRVDLGRRLVIA